MFNEDNDEEGRENKGDPVSSKSNTGLGPNHLVVATLIATITFAAGLDRTERKEQKTKAEGDDRIERKEQKTTAEGDEVEGRNPQVDSSMPRASRKQKGKGVSASGSSNGVRHSNYRGRLEVNLGRAILSERNIDLNNLIESEDSVPKTSTRTTVLGNHSDLDSGIPNLGIFRRYNLELAAELLSVKPSMQITITVFELAKLLYCIKHHERLDIGKLIRRAMIRAACADKLVLPFPALVTYFCEQAGLFPEERDRIAQMDGPLNSRTFNDISAQRHEIGLRAVATRKRQRRDAAARAAERDTEAAEEDPGAVPVGDHRPDWVSEILQGQTTLAGRQTVLEQRQTTLEKGIADLTKAIRDSYLSAAERHGGAGPSSGPSSGHDG
ncbi:hypothetical protein EZV62_002872 [Acer yangbiense]|uniref:Uncharacterized protein n=1 Tax=Acer yangbiense TaxID=1000413 RepID=A0A5C7IYK0_9ROSI|nr:hypothetical protein EZV62_002872 [Acer yangbiense]